MHLHPRMRLTNEVSTYFPMLSVYVHSQHLQQTLIPTNRMLLPHCLKKDIVDVETKIYFYRYTVTILLPYVDTGCF